MSSLASDFRSHPEACWKLWHRDAKGKHSFCLNWIYLNFRPLNWLTWWRQDAGSEVARNRQEQLRYWRCSPVLTISYLPTSLPERATTAPPPLATTPAHHAASSLQRIVKSINSGRVRIPEKKDHVRTVCGISVHLFWSNNSAWRKLNLSKFRQVLCIWNVVSGAKFFSPKD